MSTKERLGDIESRLTALEGNPPLRTRASALSTVISFATQHKSILSAVGAVLALILAAVGIWYPSHVEHVKDDFNFRVDTRIDSKLTNINKKLDEMNAKLTSVASSLDTLKPFIEDLVKRQMEKAASLPQSEFQANLPAVKDILAAARQQGVTVSPKLVNQVEQKLQTVQPRTAEFWPVSANLVSYRSFNAAPSDVRALASAQLSDCTDSPPLPMRITQVIDQYTFTFSRGIYENCRVTLDSPQANARINEFLKSQTPLITFKHCLVVYTGGPVNLIIAWVNSPETFHVEGEPPFSAPISRNSLEFENCLFEFSFHGVPPSEGQKLTETLLAQNSATVRLPQP